MSATVAVLAMLTAVPGKRDELVKALHELVEAVEGEPGTLVYGLHTSNAADDEVWFYEAYDTADSLAAHSSSEAMKAIGPSLAPLLAGRAEVTMLTPVAGKGLPL